jgi:hypothetical protein
VRGKFQAVFLLTSQIVTEIDGQNLNARRFPTIFSYPAAGRMLFKINSSKDMFTIFYDKKVENAPFF